LTTHSRPDVERCRSRWMAGIATLTMLLSRYVMNVANATASNAHGRRVMVTTAPRSTAYMYVVHLRCIGDTIRCTVVKRERENEGGDPTGGRAGAVPRGGRGPRRRAGRHRGPRDRDGPPARDRARRHADGALLALPDQGGAARRPRRPGARLRPGAGPDR